MDALKENAVEAAEALKNAAANALNHFFKLESSAGILLMLATVLALLVSNTPLNSLYEQVLGTHLFVGVGDLAVDKPILLWVNDGLMGFFFFLSVSPSIWICLARAGRVMVASRGRLRPRSL